MEAPGFDSLAGHLGVVKRAFPVGGETSVKAVSGGGVAFPSPFLTPPFGTACLQPPSTRMNKAPAEFQQLRGLFVISPKGQHP